MPSAAAITHSVKSSREPVRATCHSSHGKRRRPTTSISATNTPTSPTRHARSMRRHLAAVHGTGRRDHRRRAAAAARAPAPSPGPRPPASRRRCGRSPTRARRVLPARAAARPCSRPTSARPNTMPRRELQPQRVASPAPSAVATAICTIAPGSAMRRTASRSSNEKCSPTPNISSMTPISAS